MHNGFLYIAGGLETTRNAISAGLLTLIKNPQQWTDLGAHPKLMPAAIEEILRWSRNDDTNGTDSRNTPSRMDTAPAGLERRESANARSP